jgi:hypothetical protein
MIALRQRDLGRLVMDDPAPTVAAARDRYCVEEAAPARSSAPAKSPKTPVHNPLMIGYPDEANG